MKFFDIGKRRGRSGESGSALLIALGFLSLLLGLSLAFLATSAFSRKLAANSAAFGESRDLARSAAARAALNILLFWDQQLPTGLLPGNLNAASSYDEVSYNNNGSETTGPLDDQLKSGSAMPATKFDCKLGGIDYSGDSSTAKWLYYYDTPKGTIGRRIIGRAAFQVLPSRMAGLSLYGVTGGSKVVNDLGVIPQDFRWGRGAEELALDSSQVLPDFSSAVTASSIPWKFNTLYTAFASFFATDPEAKKKWVEAWFVEGMDPIAREVFPARDASDASGKKLLYYNRFNIGDFYYTAADRAAKDNWYDRFGWGSSASDKKNSPKAVEALTAEALVSNEDDVSDVYLAAYGLPFLRRVGSEKHSFASLELLRRQIAANFNDYCDGDDVPTSDVPAASWSVTGSLPTYTGNEKTLYVNEVGVEIGAVKLNFSDEELTIDELPARLVGELVNIYEEDAASSGLLDPANVELRLGLKKLSFKINLSCNYTGKVTYKVVSHGVTTRYTRNFSAAPTAAAAVDFSSNAVGAIAFSALNGGYAVGTGSEIQLKGSVTMSYPGGNSFKTQIRNAAVAAIPPGSGGTYESHEMTGVSASYQFASDANSQIEFTPALLRAKSDGCGLDFVRFDRTGAMPLTGSPARVNSPAPYYSHDGDRKWAFNDVQYVCGFEARDPRQNLNPDHDHPATSDWNLVPEIVAWNAHPSLTVTANAGDPSRPYVVSGGKRNRGANPAAPEYLTTSGTMVAVAEADEESATDPAAKAGNHVSTAYIRNSPMVSAWELGLIHRGREWQTLNLQKAGGFNGAPAIGLGDIKSVYDWETSGTAYAKGDGAILDFIKLGVNCRSMGKLQLKQLSSAAIAGSGVADNYSKDLVNMLFDQIRVGQTMQDFYTETVFGSPAATGGTPVATPASVRGAFVAAVDTLPATDFVLRSQFLNTAYGENAGAFTFGLAGSATDAAREELIGKTANLLSATGSAPGNVYKILVVAQTIRDVGGVNTDLPVVRIVDGTSRTLNCRIGRFDFVGDADNWKNNVYFDEITGETKALVTIERVPASDEGGTPNDNFGQLVVTDIEYL